MRIGLAVAMATKNLARYGRKSRATVVIMTVGIIAINVLYGYVVANLDLTKDAFTRWGARGDLMIERPASALGDTVEDSGEILLTSAEQAKIDKILGDDTRVAHAAKILKVSGMVANGKINFIFSGLGEEVDQIRAIKGPAYEYDVVAGHPLWQTTDNGAVVLGQGLARILGCQVPDAGFRPLRVGERPQQRKFSCPNNRLMLNAVTESGQINAQEAHPVGVMDWGIKDINNRLIVFPLAAAQSLLHTSAVSEYHVQLRDESQMSAVKRDLTERFGRAGLRLKVFYWSDRAAFYKQVRGILLSFLGFVLALAAVISFASLLNSSYMNVMAREREIGTLRSMGFGRRFLVLLLAVESGQLAALSGAIGVLSAVTITFGIRHAGWMWVPPGSSNAVPITVSWVPSMYVFSVLVLVMIAMIAAEFPATKILRKPIRAALSSL